MVAGTLWFASQGRVDEDEHISTKTAGIDTRKPSSTSRSTAAPAWQVENAPPAGRAWRPRLAEAKSPASASRPRGGYERGVVAHLRAAGFTVMVLQPIQVNAFARLHLRRAKNDTLDAVLIAACTAMIDRPKSPPDVRLAQLAAHLTFVEQIEEDIARFKTRLEHIERRGCDAWSLPTSAAGGAPGRRTAAHRAGLRGHDDLARRLDLVLSIPGIGERTALALVIRMPELGRVSREEAAALAGLAPFDDDSGKQKGQRISPAGAAVCVARSSPPHCRPPSAGTRPDRALCAPHRTRQSPQAR